MNLEKQYTTELKIDQKDNEFAYLTIKDSEENYGSWLMVKLNDTYYINSFLSGRVNNTKFRGSHDEETLIERNGRGKTSKEEFAIIRDIQKEAYKQYLGIE